MYRRKTDIYDIEETLVVESLLNSWAKSHSPPKLLDESVSLIEEIDRPLLQIEDDTDQDEEEKPERTDTVCTIVDREFYEKTAWRKDCNINVSLLYVIKIFVATQYTGTYNVHVRP